MKITAEFHRSSELVAFLTRLQSPEIQIAAARGLNEHAQEQRRQSIVGISAYTGVPAGRVSAKTRVQNAAPGSSMVAKVITRDSAIMLSEYGKPVWDRSMKGAEATGWNVRRVFPGTFFRGGQVFVRTSKSRTPLKALSMAVLANELAKPSRPNVPAAKMFAAFDLEKRVLRHVIRAIGA